MRGGCLVAGVIGHGAIHPPPPEGQAGGELLGGTWGGMGLGGWCRAPQQVQDASRRWEVLNHVEV